MAMSQSPWAKSITVNTLLSSEFSVFSQQSPIRKAFSVSQHAQSPRWEREQITPTESLQDDGVPTRCASPCVVNEPFELSTTCRLDDLFVTSKHCTVIAQGSFGSVFPITVRSSCRYHNCSETTFVTSSSSSSSSSLPPCLKFKETLTQLSDCARRDTRHPWSSLVCKRVSFHPQNLKRVQAEIKALTAIQTQPGVVQLLLWIITRQSSTEWVCDMVFPRAYGTFIDVMKAPFHRQPFSWRQTLLTLCQTVQGLHRRGIFHCDLKPSNILVNKAYLPILADFGMAKELSPLLPFLECSHASRGTLGYQSPWYMTLSLRSLSLKGVFGPVAQKSAEATTMTIDTINLALSDRWSLGLVMLEFLSRETIFRSTSTTRLPKQETKGLSEKMTKRAIVYGRVMMLMKILFPQQTLLIQELIMVSGLMNHPLLNMDALWTSVKQQWSRIKKKCLSVVGDSAVLDTLVGLLHVSPSCRLSFKELIQQLQQHQQQHQWMKVVTRIRQPSAIDQTTLFQ